MTPNHYTISMIAIALVGFGVLYAVIIAWILVPRLFAFVRETNAEVKRIIDWRRK